MRQVIHRKELHRIIKKFMSDPNRGISIDLFADLAGVSKQTLFDVFVNDVYPLSEYVQRRVSKAYQSWRNGEVAIMANRNTSRFVQYRKVPKPRLARSMGLQLVDGQIRMKIGVINRSDYSNRDLDEQLRGK